MIDPRLQSGTHALPILHPDELAELRKMSNKPDLTNDEAQLLLREVTIWNAFQDWMKVKKAAL